MFIWGKEQQSTEINNKNNNKLTLHAYKYHITARNIIIAVTDIIFLHGRRKIIQKRRGKTGLTGIKE